MRNQRTFSAPPEDDLSDRVIMSIKTKGFESQIEVPLPLNPGDADAFVMSWLKMMEQALMMPHVAPLEHPRQHTMPVGPDRQPGA